MKVSGAESRGCFLGREKKRWEGREDGELTGEERKRRMQLGRGSLLLLMVSYAWQA